MIEVIPRQTLLDTTIHEVNIDGKFRFYIFADEAKDDQWGWTFCSNGVKVASLPFTQEEANK